MLTQLTIKELLTYDPDTGDFRWLIRSPHMFSNSKGYAERSRKTWNVNFAGKSAGTVDKEGYILIVINYVSYKAHHIAWCYMTGEWPKDQIDHKDTDEGNNRWLNLREANNSQNHANINVPITNKLGVKGVSVCGRGFQARIKKKGKTIYLGWFTTKEAASIKYQEAAQEIYGEFARA